MSYQITTDFKAGLDARKYKLALPAGALTEIINAHITSGAEIEKRKKFLRVPIPAGTFGAQETKDGIVVFGSRETSWPCSPVLGIGGITRIGGQVFATIQKFVEYAPAVGQTLVVSDGSDASLNGTITVTSVLIAGTAAIIGYAQAGSIIVGGSATYTLQFPAPFIFQRLVHPVAGVTMTGIPASTYFNGEVQSLSSWSNGDLLAFSGGTIEDDFFVGLQSNITPTPFSLANKLADAIDATGKFTTVKAVLPTYLYIQITGGTASAGVNYVGAITYDFGRVVTLPDSSLSGSRAATTFTLSATVDWTTSNNATALAVKAAVNANPYGFTAFVGTDGAYGMSANVVIIVPPATDFNGATLGVADTDQLDVTAHGNVVLYVPPYDASFSVFSIPSQSSSNPYNVAVAVEDANLTYKLVSNGVAATLPTSAAGQFTIWQGSSNVAATDVLTISGIPANNNTVTIGASGTNQRIYTFVTFLTGTANQVLIGADAATSLTNLVAAINGTAGAGSIYSVGTSANPLVSASAVVALATTVTSSIGGTAGNIPVTESSAVLAWTNPTLTGGGPDTNQITQITVGTQPLLASYVSFNKTPVQTAADVVAAINAYQGTSGFTATAKDNVVTISAVNPGTSVNEATVTIVSAGNVCIANCALYVYGTGGSNISAITANGTNLLTATMTFQDGGHPTETMAQFCARVAANINANSGVSLYLAYSSANVISISAVTVSSIDSAVDVEVTSTLSLAPTTTTPLLATVNTNQISMVQTVPGNFNDSTAPTSINAPNSALVTVTGGVPPYSYNWTSLGTTALFKPQLVGFSNQWWVEARTQIGTIIQGHTSVPTYGYQRGTESWICTVTDATGLQFIAPVIYLTF